MTGGVRVRTPRSGHAATGKTVPYRSRTETIDARGYKES